MNLLQGDLTNFIVLVIVVLILGSFLNKKEGFGNFVHQQPKRTVHWLQKGDQLVVGHENCSRKSIIDFRIPADMGALENLTLDMNVTTPKDLVGQFKADIRFNGRRIGNISGLEPCQRKLDLTWLMKWTYGTEYAKAGDYHTISVVSCSQGVPVVVSNAKLTMCYHINPHGPKLGWYRGPN
ncbi:MAG: hypothetical protein CMF62_01570 [Magnetococcales bacterium]|nr:hypothetical protein [Magnetococcales bacterium]|tara:strand:- start:44856 stop:45398 length:543 start_codon:yes stop_codon:yes gene_type:complete